MWLQPRTRDTAGNVFGPKLSEGLVTAEDIVQGYDKKLTELWGGPPPKHFPDAMETWPSKYDLKGRVALVTGGAAGIGFYISKLLAELGAEVIIPWREGFEHEAQSAVKAILAASPAAKVRVSKLPLDLGSFKSVRSFAAECKGRLGQLDLLCLNAGRELCTQSPIPTQLEFYGHISDRRLVSTGGGSKGDPRELTEDGVESIVQVNALAHFLLTAELMPLLLKSSAARVVSQSSGARKLWKPLDVPARMREDLSAATIMPAKYDAFSQYRLRAINHVVP